MCTSPSEMTNKASGIRDQFAHTFFLSVIKGLYSPNAKTVTVELVVDG